jgi:transposase
MYTDPVQWADVRRRVLVDRRSIRSVCRALGISRKTVRKMVRQEQPGKFKRVERATRIGAHRGLIDEMLREDERLPQRQRRTIAAICRALQDDHDYRGGYSAVCRYCRSVQIPRILLDVRVGGAGETVESLTIAREQRTYRLASLPTDKGAPAIELRLQRDRRSERRQEVIDWIERLRAERLTQPIRGDPVKVEQLLRNVHVPERRRRDRAVAALAHEQGFSNNQIAACLGLDRRTCRRYRRVYEAGGPDALLSPDTRSPRKSDNEALKAAVFRLLHGPPADHGINRTSWIMRDLRSVLVEQGFAAGTEVVRQIIHGAGWKWRKARIVLTSQDPAYREKLAAVQAILSNLGADEAFFSIDEFGPFAVKMKQGLKLDPPGPHRVVPQWQKSKGCMIMTAALELSGNQVTHFYSDRKNTTEMIRMMDLLLDQYADRRTIYLSWDAASWHVSKKLRKRIEEHNSIAAGGGRPRVETAPLPAGAQFLNVIESIFSGMARAVIHNSDYTSVDDAKAAIDRYFAERNRQFQENPKPAGKRIWGKELVPAAFSDANNCKDPRWR